MNKENKTRCSSCGCECSPCGCETGCCMKCGCCHFDNKYETEIETEQTRISCLD